MKGTKLFVTLAVLMATIGHQFSGMLNYGNSRSYKSIRHKRGYKAFKRKQRRR